MNKFYDAFLTFRGIRRYNNFLARTDRAQPEEVHRLQSEWLGNLLRHAHAHIPWYSSRFRRFGVRTDSKDPFAELAKLPILTKAQVRENHADFCAPGAATRALRFTTSGTTGEPLIAYTSPEQWVVEQAAIWRQWRWAGYRLRDRMAIFRSYSPKSDEPNMKFDRLRNWAYFSVFRMNDDYITEYARFLQRWRPRYLRGYPSSLLLLARHALRNRWRLPGLRAAFAASETVSTEIRDTMRDALGIEIFDHYGQAEITCMLHDCEKHEGLHVDWEYGFIELLPSSEAGLYRIIATNLHNTAMPLLRYDTGDLAEGGWCSCSCGRTSPMIRAIRGRQDDFLFARDGTRMSTVNLYTYFSKLPDVERFQLSQSVPGEIVVDLSLWGGADDSRHRSLSESIRSDLGETTGLSIVIRNPPQFWQSRDGKFPPFVQNIGK